MYVAYAADGTPLYVGLSSRPDARWKSHRYASSWFAQAARWECHWETRGRWYARMEEKRLIRLLKPRHNQIGGADRELPCR